MQAIDLSIEHNLVELAKEIGLDGVGVQSVLDHRDYQEAVTKDQNRAQELNITGVPYFVIDEKYAVSGARSVENFKMVLEKD